MVIKELLELGRKKLDSLEYIDPIKESIYLLAKVLGVDKSYLYINMQNRVSKEQEESFLKLVARRSSGEPISYIFSRKEFMGIDFFVEKGVLIPRPETEMLVEYIIGYIEEKYSGKTINVLDIGIGTGAISLSIAKKCKNTNIIGVDIEDDPIRIANKNLEKLNLKNVEFRKSDLFENIDKKENFSIIVSNPPYIRTGLIEELQIDVKDFEPKAALDGGEDGLVFYRRISNRAREFMLDGGMLIYEIGFDQGQKVKEILLENDFKDVRIIKDLQGLDRIVLGFKK